MFTVINKLFNSYLIYFVNLCSYDGILLENGNEFQKCLSEGFESENLRNLVIWLTNEISGLGRMEEKVNQCN